MSLWIALALQVAVQQPQIVHASREDCEIIVEIGRAKAAWGASGPVEPFAIDGTQPGGGIYREDCPWDELGVGAPIAATGKPGPAFGVDKPVYGPDGDTATANLDFIVVPKARQAPFTSVLSCTLDKVGGRWKLRDCKQALIT